MSALNTQTRPGIPGAAIRPLPHGRRAFTLVELLTVIIIIGILAGLIVAAAIPARNRARIAAVNVEMNQLQTALEVYRDKYGDYPPDFFGTQDGIPPVVQTPARAAVLRHIRRAFPKYQPGANLATPPPQPWERLRQDLANGGIDLNQLNPATALAFWLGGLPDTTGTSSTRLIGFSADPANPFCQDEQAADTDFNSNGRVDGNNRQSSLFEFDETRLVDPDENGPIRVYYFQPNLGSGAMPYVYFRARMDSVSGRFEYGYGLGTALTPVFFDRSGTAQDGINVCVPYLQDAWVSGNQSNRLATTSNPSEPNEASGHVRQWGNLKTFQILSAGLDGQYGVRNDPVTNQAVAFRFLLTEDRIGGSGLTEGDYDNLANFYTGKLEDNAP